MSLIPVIDLFAGPGGLNEGFSSVLDPNGQPVFTSIGSFEMDATAVATLTLRHLYRDLVTRSALPDTYYSFISGELPWAEFTSDPVVAEALETAISKVHQVELGSADDGSNALIRSALAKAGVKEGSPWVLVGGPPCQAYSLAGRSRRTNDDEFANDKKHFLYREYLRIIRTFRPAVFVMENVKGLLSSSATGEKMFDLIKADLEHPNEDWYDIHSLVVDADPADLNPADFVIRSEKYGIPQKRHRVILLGVKRGFLSKGLKVGKLETADEVTVEVALSGIGPIRSGISPVSMDSDDDWFAIRTRQSRTPTVNVPLGRGGPLTPRTGEPGNVEYSNWIIDPQLDGIIQHQSRSHMEGDLKRYWFAADRAAHDGASPSLREFPTELLPNHKNIDSKSRPFEDRFRVQLASRPSTTVVSHIAKDGHYYIHPDPNQMRSLTVREAARLQTFPDNYFFWGNRTQQYHQVGNAVPPLLAFKIGHVVANLFTHPRQGEPASGASPVTLGTIDYAVGDNSLAISSIIDAVEPVPSPANSV